MIVTKGYGSKSIITQGYGTNIIEIIINMIFAAKERLFNFTNKNMQYYFNGKKD